MSCLQQHPVSSSSSSSRGASRVRGDRPSESDRGHRHRHRKGKHQHRSSSSHEGVEEALLKEGPVGGGDGGGSPQGAGEGGGQGGTTDLGGDVGRRKGRHGSRDGGESRKDRKKEAGSRGRDDGDRKRRSKKDRKSRSRSRRRNRSRSRSRDRSKSRDRAKSERRERGTGKEEPEGGKDRQHGEDSTGVSRRRERSGSRQRRHRSGSRERRRSRSRSRSRSRCRSRERETDRGRDKRRGTRSRSRGGRASGAAQTGEPSTSGVPAPAPAAAADPDPKPGSSVSAAEDRRKEALPASRLGGRAGSGGTADGGEPGSQRSGSLPRQTDSARTAARPPSPPLPGPPPLPPPPPLAKSHPLPGPPPVALPTVTTGASPAAAPAAATSAGTAAAAAAAAAGAAAAGAKKRPLLSFGDELEELAGEEGGNGGGGAKPSVGSAKRASVVSSKPRAAPGASLSSSLLTPSLSPWTLSRPSGSGLGSEPLLGLDLGQALGLRPGPSGSSGGGLLGLGMDPRPSSVLSSDFLRGEGGGKGSGFGDDVGGMPPLPSSGEGSGLVAGRAVFGVATARNQRPYMEDRHVLVQVLRPLSASGQPQPGAAGDDGVERSWAAVFDGHNGSRAAEVAASRLHMVFAADPALRAFGGGGAGGPPAVQAAEGEAVSGALRRAFRTVDDDLLKQARAEGHRDGATALVVTRLGDCLYAAHAGDSRAVLCRAGVALRLTEDHKPNLSVEKARVEAAGGRVEFQRCWRVVVEPKEGRPGSGLAVSRSLGDLDFKEPCRFVECDPDVRRMQLQPDDSYVVLGSDGLWDVLSDEDAVECANKALKVAPGGVRPAIAHQRQAQALATAAAEALLQLAVMRGTVDNVTVVVMLLQWG